MSFPLFLYYFLYFSYFSFSYFRKKTVPLIAAGKGNATAAVTGKTIGFKWIELQLLLLPVVSSPLILFYLL